MMCSFVVSYAKFKDRALGLLPCPLMHVNWMKSGILLVAFLSLPPSLPRSLPPSRLSVSLALSQVRNGNQSTLFVASSQEAEIPTSYLYLDSVESRWNLPARDFTRILPGLSRCPRLKKRKEGKLVASSCFRRGPAFRPNRPLSSFTPRGLSLRSASVAAVPAR